MVPLTAFVVLRTAFFIGIQGSNTGLLSISGTLYILSYKVKGLSGIGHYSIKVTEYITVTIVIPVDNWYNNAGFTLLQADNHRYHRYSRG